jgi:hypothetical protein
MYEKSRWLLCFFAIPVLLLVSGCVATSSSVVEDTVVVPSVLGQDLDEAKATLESVNPDFRVIVRDAQAERSVIWKSNWSVISQTPSPGTLVSVTSKVCLQVIKKNERMNLTETEPMPECGDDPASSLPTSAVDTPTTVSAKSKEEALNELASSLNTQGGVALSDSPCGSFAFLVSLDGSYHLYEWSNERWVSRATYLEQLFPKTIKSVSSVDATGDDVADFLVKLPTWDPLSKSKPLSGAIFASIGCKWQWLTFRTSTGEDWYQLDFLTWDENQGRIIAGDEVTDMFGPNYNGERKTEFRYFEFNDSTTDFRLSAVKPTRSSPTTSDPFASLPSAVRDAVRASCYWPAKDLAAAYGVSSKSKKRIAEAVAADFQEQYQELVVPLCLQYIKKLEVALFQWTYPSD